MKRSYQRSFTEFSKPGLWLRMQMLFIGLILIYQSLWLFSEKTIADCYVNVYGPRYKQENSGTLVYAYTVDGEKYEDYGTRNELPITKHTIGIRYLRFAPSFSRIDSFENNWLGFLIGYGIFFTVTSMIFFIPNETMPKHSFFYFTGKRPWIHMIVK